MDENTKASLDALHTKIDTIEAAVKTMRRNSQIILWVTITMIVLPVLGLLLVIPSFIRSYSTTLDGLL